MKHLRTFNLFETLKSFDMQVAKRSIARDMAVLGIKDYTIYTDEDIYIRSKEDNGYLWQDYIRQMDKGKTRDEILDKLIIVSFGTKTGDVSDAINNMDAILKSFEKTGWFVASTKYEYGDKLPPFTDLGGYTGSKISDKTKGSNNLVFPKDTVVISFALDPIFDTKLNPKSRVFYHVTKTRNVDSILKKGLLPKTKSKRTYYPERIFLADDLNSAKHILPNLKDEDPGEYSILLVNLPEDISVYKDTRYKNHGVYILEPISPKNIEIIKQ